MREGTSTLPDLMGQLHQWVVFLRGVEMMEFHSGDREPGNSSNPLALRTLLEHAATALSKARWQATAHAAAVDAERKAHAHTKHDLAEARRRVDAAEAERDAFRRNATLAVERENAELQRQLARLHRAQK